MGQWPWNGRDGRERIAAPGVPRIHAAVREGASACGIPGIEPAVRIGTRVRIGIGIGSGVRTGARAAGQDCYCQSGSQERTNFHGRAFLLSCC
jgi:hypothetical protein